MFSPAAVPFDLVEGIIPVRGFPDRAGATARQSRYGTPPVCDKPLQDLQARVQDRLAISPLV
jgi:hypothetical protein